MSRYYCKDCEMEFNWDKRSAIDLIRCPVCKLFRNSDGDLTKLPDYETPEQYEKRTRKEISGDLAVWYRTPYEHIDPKTKQRTGEIKLSRWKLGEYHKVKQLQFMGGLGAKPYTIVVANFPEPPPDDWKPEEGV